MLSRQGLAYSLEISHLRVPVGTKEAYRRIENFANKIAHPMQEKIISFPQDIRSIKLVFYGDKEDIRGSGDLAVLVQAARTIRRIAHPEAKIEIITRDYRFDALSSMLNAPYKSGYIKSEGITINSVNFEGQYKELEEGRKEKADLVISFNETQFKRHIQGKVNIALSEVDTNSDDSYARLDLDKDTFYVPAGLDEGFDGLYIDKELEAAVMEYSKLGPNERIDRRINFLSSILGDKVRWDNTSVQDLSHWDWMAAYQDSTALIGTFKLLQAARTVDQEFAKKDILLFTFNPGSSRDVLVMMKYAYVLGFDFLDLRNDIVPPSRSPSKTMIPLAEYAKKRSDEIARELHDQNTYQPRYVIEFESRYQPKTQNNIGRVIVVNLGSVDNETLTNAFLFSNLPVAAEGNVTPTKVIQMRKPALFTWPFHLYNMREGLKKVAMRTLTENGYSNATIKSILLAMGGNYQDHIRLTLIRGLAEDPNRITRNTEIVNDTKIFTQHKRFEEPFRAIGEAVVARGSAFDMMLKLIKAKWDKSKHKLPSAVRKKLLRQPQISKGTRTNL